MSKYKALIVDIDGTVGAIGTDGSDITEQTQQMIRKAQGQGKIIACATGRRWPTTKPVIEKLNITGPCIIQGGSCIIDPKTEKVLWEMTLSQAQTKQIFGIFAQFSRYFMATTATTNKELLPQVLLDYPEGPNRIIYLMGVDAETALKVKDAVNATDFAVAHKTTPSWYGPEYTDIHVTNPGATKEHAIAEWQKLVGITKDQTIGLGDSENDLPLFSSVGLKIAVGNAHDNLKIKADMVVSAHHDGGLEEVMNDYLVDK
jgi:5-amino-6-(5-phospho-D-ribitylamino)uracil phosphatase